MNQRENSRVWLDTCMTKSLGAGLPTTSQRNGGSGMSSFTWIRLRAYQSPFFVSHVAVATTLRILAHSLPGLRTLPAQTMLTCATISTTGFPVPAPPAPTYTSATNLDAQEPILERTTMISPTPDPAKVS